MVVRSTVKSTLSSSIARSIGGSGGGAGAFLPTSIAGLSLWLDAADADTVLNSVSPDVSATDGQTVRRWIDKSENSLHQSQSTGLNQPLFQTGEINSLSTVHFDGTNDILLGTLPNISTATIFQVHRSTKATTQIWLNGQDAAKYLVVTSDGTVSGAVTAGVGTPSFRVNGASASFATRDAAHDALCTGIATILTATSVDLSTWSKTATEFRLGYQVSVGFGIGGDLCELLFYDGSLSSQNISAVESYLASKWGVALS